MRKRADDVTRHANLRNDAECGEVLIKRIETLVKLLTTPSAYCVSPEQNKERADKTKQDNSERGATNSIFKLKSNYET